MPTSTTRPPSRPVARRPAPTATQSAARARRQSARGTDGLPGWDALGGAPHGHAPAGRVARAGGRTEGGVRQATRRAEAKRRLRALDAVPSWRSGLAMVLACLVVTLFVSHVYATRHTLDALQDARRENERLRLSHQRLSGAFDRMTAPDRVMPRALALGLVEGIAYGPPIALDPDPSLD